MPTMTSLRGATTRANTLIEVNRANVYKMMDPHELVSQLLEKFVLRKMQLTALGAAAVGEMPRGERPCCVVADAAGAGGARGRMRPALPTDKGEVAV
ncbi:hypothetical protein Q4I30_008381 [Leishmania utingensis]|uniref:Uncharacterized protein n=1 Tax=Leishmania utingensis TaxID=653362 RepID=A0AAW2ZVG8_9TRYP